MPKVEDQAAIHLRIEVEVEVVERLLRIAEGGLFAPMWSKNQATRE
jgi:hypothetical protein